MDLKPEADALLETEIERDLFQRSVAPAPLPLRRILVGVNGSAVSAKAARFAARLVGATGELALLFVCEPVPSGFGEDQRAIACSVFEDFQQTLGLPNERIKTLLRTGQASEILAEVSRESDIDLVVVGHRAGSRLARVEGIVAKLSATSDRPVLIVR